MERYALLVLRDKGNRVIGEFTAPDKSSAIRHFNETTDLVMLDGSEQKLALDEDGYFQDGPITYTIAQYLY